MSIGTRLKEFSAEFGGNRRLSEALGKLEPAMYKYYNDTSKPGAEVLEELHKLGADVYYIITGEKKSTVENKVLELPYIVEGVSAGCGNFMFNEIVDTYKFDWVKQGYIIVRARGLSMHPTISDGDDMVVNPRIDKARDNSIVIIEDDKGEHSVKRAMVLDNKAYFISDNPDYGNKEYKNIKVIGEVLKVIKDMKKRKY